MADDRDLRARVEELLRECSTMSLATQGPEGLWAADVFFAPRTAAELIFISSPTTRHAANLLASPAVAATIHVDTGNDWRSVRGLQLSGTAALVPDSEVFAARSAYVRKFPFAAPLLAADSEIASKAAGTRFFALTVAQLFLVDNRLGFGVRFPVALEAIR